MNQQEKNLFIAHANAIIQQENAFNASIKEKKKLLINEVYRALRREPIRSIMNSKNGCNDQLWMRTTQFSSSGITVSCIGSRPSKNTELPLKDIPVTDS